MPRKADRRSPEANAYRPWYKTARWRALRAAQLSEHPLCQQCLKRGLIVPATVAHHAIPHKGDLRLFWEGALESVCAPCHDGPIKAEEARGFSAEVGADGWPTDDRHPANRQRA